MMCAPSIRRFFAVLAFAVWIGGFTFYAAVAVPAGAEVLGSAEAQGFITEVVSARLNALGVPALAVLAWNALASRGRPRAWLFATWAVMAVSLATLFALHPALSRLLDHEGRVVVREAPFYWLHRVYLLVSAAQWVAGLAHVAAALAAWRAEVSLPCGTAINGGA